MAEAFISRRGGGTTINGQEFVKAIFLEEINRGDRVVMRPSRPSSKIEDPSTLPTGDGWGCAFSPNGKYLAVAHDSSPYITIYKRSGDTFTKLSNPSVLPTGAARGCAFYPDGIYLAVAHDSSPYITIYKGEYQANLYIDGSTYNFGDILGYAVESGTSNETKKVAKLFKI
ncbi:MAG TPA: hypothetical protein PLD49_11110 [Thermoclostridium caenicola]|nr:hypothetical protein [Thermoclostridium caenicola]